MQIEIHMPLGHGPPLVLESDQVIIRNGEGTPICIAVTRGPNRCAHVAHSKDGREFSQLLRLLGLPAVEVIDLVQPPPPQGRQILFPGQA